MGAFLAVRHAPVVVQEYVPKQVELRITVVGDRVFAAEIDSQASPMARHDWRAGDPRTMAHRRHPLPLKEAERCLRLTRALDLCFGAIDMVLTPGGEYVFLEINPNGQWGWIQDLTGMPIAEVLAEILAVANPADARYY
jgi:glutathione synthase/RimK-type ligase-like ATP-grasp enzyme